jgi:hypothetical protein
MSLRHLCVTLDFDLPCVASLLHPTLRGGGDADGRVACVTVASPRRSKVTQTHGTSTVFLPGHGFNITNLKECTP